MNAPLHVPRARSSGRARLLLGVVFAVILAAATAALPGIAKAAAICSSQTGTNGGYYYQMYTAGSGSACITLNSGNSYSTSWSNVGDFVAGVGFNPGSNAPVNQPSIQGTATFEQYLAIRTSPVSSGTITTANFFNAWASHGMNLGTLNYQILATEAYSNGSGSSSVTAQRSCRRSR